ncbi:MAG: phosphoribosyltransferase family protein [Pseudomonadota bacterium]
MSDASADYALPSRRIVQADELQLDAFRLARKIYDSGFRPDFLVGLWRGGSAVAIAVQEGLDYFGIKTDHISVRTSYAGRDQYARMIGADAKIRVHGLPYLLQHLNSENALLIVDDVCGTGRSTLEVIDQLQTRLRRNMPHDVRVASVWHRPSARTVRPPEFFVNQTDEWLVLPYELTGLSREEIAASKEGMADVLEEFDDVVPG